MPLAVELYGTIVGHLSTNGSLGHLSFVASDAGVERFGTGSTVLSRSLRLRQRRPARPEHAAAFFEGLLPEGAARAHLAARAELNERDTSGMLARYGRDVAGALQIWDVDDPDEPPRPGLLPLGANDVAMLLREQVDALGNAPEAGKSLLAGMQPKIVLAHVDGTWHQATGGHPTTHILKPAARTSTPIFREHYGLRLAAACGLLAYEVRLDEFDGLPTLVVARYDRDPSLPGGRLHQEDMAQALALRGDQKYQERGGKVWLARIADSLEMVDRRRFAERTVFSWAINDLDAHAKNVSLLHPMDGSTKLAPHYDAVPFALRSSDGRFAMAYAGRYVDHTVQVDDVVDEIAGWSGMRAHARTLVAGTLERIEGATRSVAPDPRTPDELVDEIAARVRGALAAIAD